MNVIDLALNWQLFSDVGRPRSFVNVMSTNSTLDPERRRHSYLKGIPLCSDRVKLFFWGGGLIFETNCIFEYKPSPHFRLDVVYKMGGGVLTGHYGNYIQKSRSIISYKNGSIDKVMMCAISVAVGAFGTISMMGVMGA